jgi:hypothetical protein
LIFVPEYDSPYMMVVDRTQKEARPPNWLPLPGEGLGVHVPAVEEDDLFAKGEVISFHPRQGLGYVRSARGELLPFQVSEIDLVGPKGMRQYIEVGCRVGFDASVTTDGRKVTRLKIY